ncbi:MAG: CBS domain-containing protein [Acidobacteria bacterium]|jgi:CBS domain-containing protein|nr:CBS domain-containing protein [Acidobacteriota bacterium]
MNILEMCDVEGASVPLDATAEQAIRTMLDRRVGAVAVLDENTRIAGIFTERDVLRRVALSGREPAQIPIREVMTTPVEMATLDTTPGEALATMVERHYRHLPIVDDDSRLLGMLSIRNVLQARIDTLTRQLDKARSMHVVR